MEAPPIDIIPSLLYSSVTLSIFFTCQVHIRAHLILPPLSLLM